MIASLLLVSSRRVLLARPPSFSRHLLSIFFTLGSEGQVVRGGA